jgi:hypothetical protein
VARLVRSVNRIDMFDGGLRRLFIALEDVTHLGRLVHDLGDRDGTTRCSCL